jgi:hypothetical protein
VNNHYVLTFPPHESSSERMAAVRIGRRLGVGSTFRLIIRATLRPSAWAGPVTWSAYVAIGGNRDLSINVKGSGRRYRK